MVRADVFPAIQIGHSDKKLSMVRALFLGSLSKFFLVVKGVVKIFLLSSGS